ncbi:hypothetical protein NZ698_00385 [Chryseobacterium sp. PBS4-4]|uniref:Peptidase M10 metallopeptidase domain-containing protein n=1 Tax=Chryseobacterium edaphi TaxID=2976532 RepID=A0ABT2W063_9FLAO|nr:hypothetical protein [Chryseobacterium edaphi]MCU7615637.1 hypothetical protein [Chryseobacterium edaphi]
MNYDAHKTELKKIIPEANAVLVSMAGDNDINQVKYNIKRELCRHELGHLFSLGMCNMKRSGEGITVTFDLTKASINKIYINEHS